MTTISIQLDDATAERLAAEARSLGQTPEEYARTLLSQSESWSEFLKRNEEVMRALGITSDEEAEVAIARWVEEVRHPQR